VDGIGLYIATRLRRQPITPQGARENISFNITNWVLFVFRFVLWKIPLLTNRGTGVRRVDFSLITKV